VTIPDRDLLISAPQLFVWRLRQRARKLRDLRIGEWERTARRRGDGGREPPR
jgi:hypothetical protein